jgi:hypothetical protein
MVLRDPLAGVDAGGGSRQHVSGSGNATPVHPTAPHDDELSLQLMCSGWGGADAAGRLAKRFRSQDVDNLASILGNAALATDLRKCVHVCVGAVCACLPAWSWVAEAF